MMPPIDLHPPLDDLKPMQGPAGEWLNIEEVHLSENWSQNADTTMTLQKFLARSSRPDSIRWSYAFEKDPAKCEEGWKRFIGEKNGLHIIPTTLDCDRTFLRDRRDAAYLEAAVKYLRGVSPVRPIMTPTVWLYPFIGQVEKRIRAKNWAVGAAEASNYYKRLIAPADWAAFSCKNIQGRFRRPLSHAPSMLINPSTFPRMPQHIYDLNAPCHLGVELSRIAYYFAQTVCSYTDGCVRERYKDMLGLESSINVIVAFMEEKDRGRVWDIRREHDRFLKLVLPSLPKIRFAGGCEHPSALGDLGNVVPLLNLWNIYKNIMSKSKKRFEEGENILAGKLLDYHGITLCFDSDLLDQDGGTDKERNSVGPSESIVPAETYLTQSTSAARHNNKRPRMATTAHRRTMPLRRCRRKSK